MTLDFRRWVGDGSGFVSIGLEIFGTLFNGPW